MPEKVLSEK